MSDFLAGVIILGSITFFGWTTVSIIANPNEDDVILELVKLGAIESTVVNGQIVDTLVNQKYRPLLSLWEGKGLSFNGNVISH